MVSRGTFSCGLTPAAICCQHFVPFVDLRIPIPDGEILEGKIQSNKMKLAQAWIEIHRDDLMADWELAVNGQEVFKIDPLK